jgi:beta-mannosidase
LLYLLFTKETSLTSYIMKFLHIKKTYMAFFAFIPFVAASFAQGIPLSKTLDADWHFRQARSNNWYPATVPGTVHTDLLANKQIEDPFFRLNERNIQWIDKEDWIYETSFTLSPEMMQRSHIDILFKGLDTYADVYVNDSLVLKANNMFRQWRTDIKKYIRNGENKLKVYLHSPIKVDLPKWEALPYQYEAGNDQADNGGLLGRRVSIFARKAGYHYGWDWGPRLVTSGIWRPVIVEAWNDARLNDLFIRQKEVTAKQAVIEGLVEVISDKAGKGTVTVSDAATGKAYGKQNVVLAKGSNKVQVNFTIKNPRLWWSNGLGEQYLYHFKATLAENGKTADTMERQVGIRSLKIIHQPDKDGHSFYVELNGRPVFMKGADYIPMDNFLNRVTPAKHEKLVKTAAECHMNMLRVWGGGIYQDDVFYDLCDKYGILIWQDFMFGCSLYPAEGEFLENIRQEAIDNVCRLRNHACIALWCGNNECNDGWYSWGWKKNYEKQNPAYAAKIWKQYQDQYDVTLPAVVKEYAPDAFYWPSSPFSFATGPSNFTDGDTHYWSVWGSDKVPIEKYNEIRARFFSEYGFQSFPDFESVQRYAPDSLDWNIYSDVMMSHQRGGSSANKRIETYLLNEYQKPKDFRSFLYMNQVLQGDAIKMAMEAHHRDMPHCMGTLFWQIDDCWPVASWSSIDYYGRWKALQYFSKKAYRDILVSPILKDDKLQIFVASDRWKAYPAQLDVQIMTLDGKIVNEFTKQISVMPNASSSYMDLNVDEVLKGTPRGEVVVIARLKAAKAADDYCNHYFLVKQKEMKYPKATITYSVTPIDGGYRLVLKSDKFARAAYIATGDADATFSDNFMDIVPGEPVTVDVRTALSADKFAKQLKVISLSDAY